MRHHTSSEDPMQSRQLNDHGLSVLTYAAIGLIVLCLGVAALQATGAFEGLLVHPSISVAPERTQR